MFRNRSSQKPSDDFFKTFKASFPGLSQDHSPVGSAGAGQQLHSGSLTDALDIAQLRSFGDNNNNHHHHHQQHDFKDADPTPKGSNEPWSFTGSGLTPSFLDPDSNTFNSFANQLPGYYTPTPGGTNTLMHSLHAGDLHTPGFSMGGLGTPLSMPTSSDNSMPQMASTMQTFHAMQLQHQHMDPRMHEQHHHQFQSMNPYHMHNQQAFAPQEFHQGSQQPSYHQMGSHPSNSPSMGDVSMDMGIQNESPEMMFHPDTFNRQDTSSTKMNHPLMEKFRYHTTLNAPTAMVKQNDEIPITYLNKGQAYTLNVVDTAPLQSTVGQLKYRTFVRISFEDEEQRAKPGGCWQLWKEGRGTNEAHHRGGRLQAVEYVDPSQVTGPGEQSPKANIELESASFDGFCVTWTPGASGTIECPIPVRFNFLSTDFSHSKGVKGIPVRLCAKTELLLDSMSPAPQQVSHEVCYCKVKLFRDHGAERKLSNDVAHVKKTIEKLNQQLAQIESGMRDLGKRKRSSGGNDSQRPGKVSKHKRTWSMSSANSTGGRNSAEDDLQIKLIGLQDMFSSTRPFSVLFLRGAAQDDPDLHPVRLSTETVDQPKTEPVDISVWDKQSVQSSTMVSPTPSSRSMASLRRDSHFQRLNPPSRMSSNEWKVNAQQQLSTAAELQSSNPQHLASPPDQAPNKMTTQSPSINTVPGWIEGVGQETEYRPRLDLVASYVACFLVKPRIQGVSSPHENHWYTYVSARSMKELVGAIVQRTNTDYPMRNFEASQVSRVCRVNSQGLSCMMDDTDVRFMPENQNLIAEFCTIDAPPSAVTSSRQWESGANDPQIDGETPTQYELKLIY